MHPQSPLGPGLVSHRVRVADCDVVWIRAVLEAYDGLALTYGDGTGVLELATTTSRSAELDGLLNDLAQEISLSRLTC